MNEKLRTKIFERDNYTCQYCGANSLPTKRLLPAHIRIPSLCGDDRESNLVTLCRPCYNHVSHNEIMRRFETAENKKAFDELFKQRVENYGYEVNYIKKVFYLHGIKATRPQIDGFIKKKFATEKDFEDYKKELIENPYEARKTMLKCFTGKMTYREYLNKKSEGITQTVM